MRRSGDDLHQRDQRPGPGRRPGGPALAGPGGLGRRPVEIKAGRPGRGGRPRSAQAPPAGREPALPGAVLAPGVPGRLRPGRPGGPADVRDRPTGPTRWPGPALPLAGGGRRTGPAATPAASRTEPIWRPWRRLSPSPGGCRSSPGGRARARRRRWPASWRCCSSRLRRPAPGRRGWPYPRPRERRRLGWPRPSTTRRRPCGWTSRCAAGFWPWTPAPCIACWAGDPTAPAASPTTAATGCLTTSWWWTRLPCSRCRSWPGSSTPSAPTPGWCSSAIPSSWRRSKPGRCSATWWARPPAAGGCPGRPGSGCGT